MVVVFDLDDTLYNEIDFVKSGFKEVASYLHNNSYYDFMINTFYKEGSGKIFDKLISKYSLKISVQKLIEIYRFHTPAIKIDSVTKDILSFTKNFPTALITDGHYIVQKNKFNVLDIGQYFQFVLFTDFFHTNKKEEKPFLMVMDYFDKEKDFVYIGDNPQKDFLTCKSLGWKTVRYKNPVGIYRDFQSNADFEVLKKEEIINILKNNDQL